VNQRGDLEERDRLVEFSDGEAAAVARRSSRMACDLSLFCLEDVEGRGTLGRWRR